MKMVSTVIAKDLCNMKKDLQEVVEKYGFWTIKRAEFVYHTKAGYGTMILDNLHSRPSEDLIECLRQEDV